MAGAPIPRNDKERIKALHDLELLDTDPEPMYDRLVQIAAKVCQVPIALVSLVDEERQWFKARIGLEPAETPREYAFCGYAILEPGTLIVEDTHKDDRFTDNPLVTGSPDIRFYAGAPIPAPNGQRLGTLCVIDQKPRRLSTTQLEILELLAQQASEALVTRQVALLLRDAVASGQGEARHEALNAVAHELATPLTPLLLRLAVLQRRQDMPADIAPQLEKMQRNIERLDAAIKQTVQILKPPSRS